MKLRFIILLALAASAACHRESGTAPAVHAKPKAGVRAAAPSEHGQTPQELTRGMVEAVVQGKSQAPITLKFDLLQRPVEGQPLEIAVALLPQIAARSAAVSVAASDGLKLEPGGEQFEVTGIEPAQVYRHSIKVTPAADGLYLLTLSVSLQHDQTSDSRVFTVPILVASTAAASSAPARRPPAAAPAR
jgi:hypothetical protein